MSESVRAFVALGSNLGEREQHLADARQRLSEIDGLEIIAESAVEETAPLGPNGQGPYLNQMVALAVASSFGPHELLDRCQEIERAGGRVRGERWGERTIDIDIVRFGDEEIEDIRLSVPHPELKNRDFWQRELCELRKLLGEET